MGSNQAMSIISRKESLVARKNTSSVSYGQLRLATEQRIPFTQSRFDLNPVRQSNQASDSTSGTRDHSATGAAIHTGLCNIPSCISQTVYYILSHIWWLNPGNIEKGKGGHARSSCRSYLVSRRSGLVKLNQNDEIRQKHAENLK